MVHAKSRLSLASGCQQRCRMVYTASADNLQIQAKSFFAVKNPISVLCLLHSLQRLVSAAVTPRKWSRTCIPFHDNTDGSMRSRPRHCSDEKTLKHFVLPVFRVYPVSIISQMFLHIHPSTTLYTLSTGQSGKNIALINTPHSRPWQKSSLYPLATCAWKL